jgi:hypothetical protein
MVGGGRPWGVVCAPVLAPPALTLRVCKSDTACLICLWLTDRLPSRSALSLEICSRAENKKGRARSRVCVWWRKSMWRGGGGREGGSP